jgi:hypothetical protein
MPVGPYFVSDTILVALHIVAFFKYCLKPLKWAVLALFADDKTKAQ